MNITKGLVIDDPWIGHLLDGSKTWEMRSRLVSFRGWFGLIRKGTGAIYGVARLVDVRPALSVEEMVAAYDKHRIPESMIRSGAVAKWTTPWVLADIRKLPKPASYRHPSGAVSWVELEPQVTAAIAAQLGSMGTAASVTPVPAAAAVIANPPALRAVPSGSPAALTGKTEAVAILTEPTETHKQNEALMTAATPGNRSDKLVCEVELTEGNLTHNHFYLRPHLHLFPNDIIGGSNRSKLARKEARIDWGGPEPEFTDIDGETHKFFRRRGWIGRFYQLNRAKPGDLVSVEETGPLSYKIRLRKRTP
ncbi:hypothetical protein ACVIRO_003183 [Rhizobium ruizarguesonis]